MTKPKILLFDCETAPMTAFVWRRWKQNIYMDQVIKESYILNWSAKWLNEDYIYTDALPYHKKEYKKDPTNDRHVVETAWQMFDEADYIVAHYGDGFDIPVMAGRFLQNGMEPPSSFRSIDTKKIASRVFKLTSNKLDDLAKMFGLGGKIKTDFELWSDIVQKRCPKAWKHMIEYCERDVMLLEGVYNKLAPWDEKHPSTVVQENLDKPTCNVCGSEKVQKNGSYATNTQTYQKYKCASCGHNMRSRKADKKSKEHKDNLLRSMR